MHVKVDKLHGKNNNSDAFFKGANPMNIIDHGRNDDNVCVFINLIKQNRTKRNVTCTDTFVIVCGYLRVWVYNNFYYSSV